MQVPFLDLKRTYREISDKIEPKILNIMSHGAFVGGPEVNSFEEEFSAYCDVKYCAGVESGTGALRLILKAMDIGAGDEVVIPANTFAATAEAVCHVGAKPVLVDVDPKTKNIDSDRVRKAIGSDVKAIIAVHLYGNPAEMNALREIAEEKGVKLIEDAAQAHGATYRGKRIGNLSHAAAFSFYPGKNLGAFGDGGAVVSNDSVLIDNIKMLREHGQPEKYVHKIVGETARLDAMQAAVLRIKLEYLDANNEKRQKVADMYIRGLESENDWLILPETTYDSQSVWHLFVVHCSKRDELRDYLLEKGVGCGMHYPIPLNKQEAFQKIVRVHEDLSVSEQSSEALVSLPMFPELKDEEVRYVIDVIKEFGAKRI